MEITIDKFFVPLKGRITKITVNGVETKIDPPIELKAGDFIAFPVERDLDEDMRPDTEQKGECLYPYDYDVLTGEWHKRVVVLRQKGEA